MGQGGTVEKAVEVISASEHCPILLNLLLCLKGVYMCLRQ